MSNQNTESIKEFSHGLIKIISLILVFFFIVISIVKTIYTYNTGIGNYNIVVFDTISANVICIFTFGLFSLLIFLKRFKWKFLILIIPLYAIYDLIWNIRHIVYFGLNCMLSTYSYDTYIYFISITISSLGIIYISDIKIKLPTKTEILPFIIFLIIEFIIYQLSQQSNSCIDLWNAITSTKSIYTIGSIFECFGPLTFVISFRNIFKEKDIK